jgi:hypothetical protein
MLQPPSTTSIFFGSPATHFQHLLFAHDAGQSNFYKRDLFSYIFSQNKNEKTMHFQSTLLFANRRGR